MKIFGNVTLSKNLFLVIVLALVSSIAFSKYLIQQTKFYKGIWKTPETKQVTSNSTYIHKQSRNLTKRKLPQIIGIGVKKCSTGALRSYICAHPDVQCPSVRELRFFDQKSKFEKGEKYYRSLMPVSRKNQITFEKTPKYFSLKVVPERIKEFYKEANASVKFVLSLCDPVSRAYSDYIHSVVSKKMYNMSKLYYSSFDEYLEHELDHIKQYLDNNGLNKLQSANESYFNEYIEGTWDCILKGIYSFFLRQWLRVFPEKDILIVDGEILMEQPWLVMEEVQKFANLSFAIQKKHFVVNKNTGFYCLISNTNRRYCLGKNKGRTRLLTKNRKVKSKMSEKSHKVLKEFYRVYNEDLKKLVNQKFSWMKSDFG